MSNNVLASGLIALLLVLPAGGVAAQNDAQKPAGMKVEQGAPGGQTPAKAAPKTMKTASASGRHVEHMFDDARHCLELQTIEEIIKCAEPYRY